MMDIAQVILLSALVVLLCIHLALSTSCFCTNKDNIPLYEDVDLTNPTGTIPDIKTCFIGTRVNKEDKPMEESYTRIERLSLGRCGFDDLKQQSRHFENLFRNGSSYADWSRPYYGAYNDFFEVPLNESKKRFLVSDNEIWTEWSQWTGCAEGSFGMLIRSRSCLNPSQSFIGKTCEGDSVEIQKCPDVVEWNEWQSWSYCRKTYNDVYIQFRNRSCTIEDRVDTENSTCQENERLSYRPCHFYGTWNAWAAWSSCSLTIPAGTKIRTRTCDWTQAVDHMCLGNATEEVQCVTHGIWNSWGEWSSCSVTCENGVITRTRTCAKTDFLKDCIGSATEENVCTASSHCPVNGGWGEWYEWSSKCSVTCDQGVTKRLRQCSNPVPAYGGEYCKGDLFDIKTCIESPCPNDGIFTTWSKWSICSVTCGSGTQERNRICDPPPMYGGANCTGDYQEHTTCDLIPCPIDGDWAAWGSWSNWDKTCSFATRVRSRSCDNPLPQYHGRFCFGEFNDTESTDLGYCPVDGDWAAWGSWSNWDKTCSFATRVRSRSCDNPPPQYHGRFCFGEFNDTESTDLGHCPVDGDWAAWGSWSNWDKTCSFATRVRSRSCDNPPPHYHGRFCFGEFNDTESTDLGHCPVDGNWGLWASWTSCSVTCGEGIFSRSRICDNPYPKYDGNNCVGNTTEISSCIDRPSCAVDGMWAEWTEWFGCSKTCGPSENTRYRTCTNPRPQNGGNTCPGMFMDVKKCNLVECPVNGHWSVWSSWSDCSGTCGNSTKSRVRVCDNPLPQHNGSFCTGRSKEEAGCAQSPCPEFQCYACDGPLPELCMSMTKVVTCPEPYCINELTHNNNGEKILDRRCGTKHECDVDWWVFTSDNKQCTLYDGSYIVANNIHCTFCCTDDLCNQPTVPSRDSLYRPHS